MTQEPWNEEIYQEAEEKSETETSRKSRKLKGDIHTRIFTVLAVIFLIIVLVITIIALYLSNGGSTTNSSQEFHNPSASTTEVVEGSSAAEATTEVSSADETTTSSSLTEATDGSTLVVQEGEGEASIAARAGISIAELERLNPEKMTGPGGTWWANPGDVVRIR